MGNHSDHPSDEQEILDRKFKNYCKVQARDTRTSYKAIHANACQLYPRAIVLLKNIHKCLTQHLRIKQHERLRPHKDGADIYLGEVVWRDHVSGIDESAQVFWNLDVLRAASDHTVKHMNGTFSSVPPSSKIKVPRTL